VAEQAIRIAVNQIAQRRRRVEKVASGRQPWVTAKNGSSPGGATQFNGLARRDKLVPRLRRCHHLSNLSQRLRAGLPS